MRAGLLVAVLFTCALTEGEDNGLTAPPKHPPEDILAELTLDHSIPVEYYYVDDSNRGQGTHYKFSYNSITSLISHASSIVSKTLSKPHPPPPPITLPSSPSSRMQLTDSWLIHALKKYPVTGKHVVVYGSTSPFYEALVLAMGAYHVTVIEYNQLTYSHPNITTLLVADMNSSHTHFADVALSLSSFDHDGLGRYGDPINPNADLEATRAVQDVLKADGVLFLTVPIGPDVVVWNLHRRYGKLRLPRLLDGWDQLDCLGWREELVTKPAPYVHTYEPVFVLRPQNTRLKSDEL